MATEVDRASMRAFDSPSDNGDAQDRDGFPHGAEEFRARLEASRFRGLLAAGRSQERDRLGVALQPPTIQRAPRVAAIRLAVDRRRQPGLWRRELGLNHAGAVLAYQLLARIEQLEARLESLLR
jgi:hypothetical protein